jgi:hypothetical protein
MFGLTFVNLTARREESSMPASAIQGRHHQGQPTGLSMVKVTSWLQMGLVLYPLKSDFSGSPVIKQLIDAGIYVRVDLGDVQVAPSREDLQYSQKTIQGLVKHLNPVIDSMGSTLLADIQAAPDYFQAHLILRRFTGTGGYSSSSFREGIVKKLKGKLKWKGIDMHNDNRIPLVCFAPQERPN